MTQQNIDLCFSNFSSSEKKTIYKLSITHTTLSLIELAALWFKPTNIVLRKIKPIKVPDSFYNDRKAKIIIAPHFGSWEALNLWLAQQTDLYSLYKPTKSDSINQFVLAGRSRTSAILVPTSTTGLRTLLMALKNNKMVMILPDQRPQKQSAQLNSHFFGHSAPTTTLIHKLLSKTQCTVYMAAALRTSDFTRYEVRIAQINEADLKVDAQTSVNFLNQQIEYFIKDNVEQYQWSYRRFLDRVYGKR